MGNSKLVSRPMPKGSKHARYNSSDKGKARRSDYRRQNSKWATDSVYLSRPFIGWDGEGVTDSFGIHRYVLLANSLGGYIVDEHGLSTEAVYNFLTSIAAQNPNSIHVIYGGGYDFNCWMADYTAEQLRAVYARKFVTVGQWVIDWKRGKSFWIKNNDSGDRIKVYDVVSFFQCPFVKACDDYLGARFIDRDLIVENKEARSAFRIEDLKNIIRYNDAELANLVELMSELRERLNKVGLRPSRWDGPGAIAAALLARENVKYHKKESPPPVAQAARYAFAGGRFEVCRFGDVRRTAYEYDVNSAYPSALRNCPNLSAGTWQHLSKEEAVSRPVAEYGLYHLRYRASGNMAPLPAPIFHRARNGAIYYPLRATNWVWTPEVNAALEYVRRYGGEVEVLEAWVFNERDPMDRPFHFIERQYKKRQALKAGKDGAHVGIKLALNSIYGKTAQQVGWKLRRDGGLIVPPFHQIEWAGYVTSHCRASVLTAALENLDSIIAFETDAVFSSEPLNVSVGTALGQFEATEFQSLTYVQSGTYFGTLADGTEVARSRGVDRGWLTVERVREAMSKRNSADRYVDAELTRFVGAGIALHQNFGRWRRWEKLAKRVSVEPMGKRTHTECAACHGNGIAAGEWHSTFCPMIPAEHSSEYPIEWINPDPEMTALSELREAGYDEWDD